MAALKLMMKSRWHSIVAIAILSISLFVMPPVFILACAAIALVTLRHGIAEAGFIALAVLAVLYLISQVMGLQSTMALLMIVGLWLPIIGLSALVKQYGNIRYAFIFSPVVAVLFWLVLYQVTGGNPVEFWQEWLSVNSTPILRQIGVPTDQLDQFITTLAKSMNGIIVSGFALLVLLSVIIGRYWQSALYNPGGFSEEYQSLAIGKPVAVLALLVVLGALLLPEAPVLMVDMKQFFIMLFMFQGLAVLQYVKSVQNWPKFVVTFIYVLLFVVPQVSLLFSLLGIADNWIDIREKFAA